MTTTKPPTEQEMVAAFKREFPMCGIDGHERSFLAFIRVARSHGVGYGWMRQAIGLAWKLEDPVGYIDDERIIELHTPKRKARSGRSPQ